MKVKEDEKLNKCLEFVKGLKKLWNIKVTVIASIAGTLRAQESKKESQSTGDKVEIREKNLNHPDKKNRSNYSEEFGRFKETCDNSDFGENHLLEMV